MFERGDSVRRISTSEEGVVREALNGGFYEVGFPSGVTLYPEADRMGELDTRVSDFSAVLLEHPQFEKMSFSIKQLRGDSKWPFGHAHGVYCFVVDSEVVYVGRAIGCTIGQRLWVHLRSQSDPAWAEVVTREDNQVEVFAVDRDWAFLGAALEVYLIERLHPKFNKQLRVDPEPAPPADMPRE